MSESIIDRAQYTKATVNDRILGYLRHPNMLSEETLGTVVKEYLETLPPIVPESDLIDVPWEHRPLLLKTIEYCVERGYDAYAESIAKMLCFVHYFEPVAKIAARYKHDGLAKIALEQVEYNLTVARGEIDDDTCRDALAGLASLIWATREFREVKEILGLQ